MVAWRCPDCGTEDEALHYQSGKMARCKDCQRYYNVTVNSKQIRKRVGTPKLEITKEQFLEWARETPRQCAYCGVDEIRLARLGLRTQIDRGVEALGIDRIDSAIGYRADNIVLCCFACNKAKGNVFTSREMDLLGPAIAAVWKRRLS